jgi:putative PIG3 family NAD(P)H quinone oxidoreductase
MQTKAVLITGKGGVEVLEIGEHSVREPGSHELLVAVRASGLNRADILQRRGFYPAPKGAPANVPGLEYAGSVERVGPDVTDYKPGDRVMGIVAGGGMAGHVIVHEREAIAVPTSLSWSEAGALPEVFLTAFDALYVQSELRLGESLLVHAVGSGVGTAAVQLAKLAGARVIGTARTADKIKRCKAFGLDAGIVLSKQQAVFCEPVLSHTAGRGADVILDGVGAAYLEENLKSLVPAGGRLCVIGLLGGASAQMPLGLLLSKRARVIGTVLRSRPLEEKAALVQAFRKQVLPHLEEGTLKPVIDQVFPMREVRAAHERMESNESFGKIVLEWD